MADKITTKTTSSDQCLIFMYPGVTSIKVREMNLQTHDSVLATKNIIFKEHVQQSAFIK